MIDRERLGPVADAVRAAADDLTTRDAVGRMRRGDHTLWQDDPTEVADRLGWLPVVAELRAQVDDLEAFAAQAYADGFRFAVLLGMGGSSLFPEVLRRTFGTADGRLQLRVLDTTDPAAIQRVQDEVDLDVTLFVAASKSGGTIETRSQLEHFWTATDCKPEQFVVITDAGSELDELATARGFRRTFQNRSDIGGRYSALSHFGMVPGALIGAPIADLLDRAAAVMDDDDTPVRLAAALGGAAKAGHDKLTLVLPDEIAAFSLWLEQLVAESTGKHGTGILPVAGEDVGPPEVYGDDRLFVAVGGGVDLEPVVDLAYRDKLDIGALVVVFEEAVALAGAVLGINPFDQPDVASAKAATNKVLDEGLPDIEPVPVESLLDQVRPGDYLAITAFVDLGDDALLDRLQRARMALRDRLHVATTLGIGPRFLHSTGQLHKGGPPEGVFVQVVGDDPNDIDIPGKPFTFSTLKQAQAAGDLQALHDHGLRAGRVRLSELLEVST